MAVQINVAANQAALTASIQAGVQAYNQKFAQNNQINLSVNQRAFSQPLGRMTGDVKDFEAALAASNARVIAFGASTAVLGGVIRSFKELANVTIEVEKSLADINRVFGLTTSQLQKFSTDLFDVSKQTASSFDDASKAALEFSRQGLKAEETLQRTKDALTLTRLAGIGTANAVDALTSTVNGFATSGITTTQILNKLIAVEQDYAVGAGDLAEALSRTGQAAQEAGVSLDQLNALVTSAQQSTARGGAVIGNALKTIFTRLQRNDTLDQLQSFNIAVRDIQGNTLPAVTILQNFAGAYKNLGDAQKAQLSEQVAGVYQVNILKAIVNDLNKSQSVYSGALQRGASATNEAEVATAKLNQTLDALLKQTSTSTQQLANNIGKVTFEPLAKYGTQQLKSFIETINEMLEGEGAGSTFANGLLKGIRNVIAGPGAIAAFFTLFKLIQNSFTYLGQALPQIAGITTETQNRKNIEQSILQIMQQQGPVSQALAGNMGNQAAQAQLLLQIARQQTAEYQMQTTLAKQLAVQLAGQGVRVKGSGGLQVTRAGGYIPNATRMAEVVGAQAGGYTPGRVVSSPVGGVMNTAEDVKYIPGFAQPFINPPANSTAGRAHRQNAISRTGVDPYMYSGFIPNFAQKSIKSLGKQSLNSLYDVGDRVGNNTFYDKYDDQGLIKTFNLPYTYEEYRLKAAYAYDNASKIYQKDGLANANEYLKKVTGGYAQALEKKYFDEPDTSPAKKHLNKIAGGFGEQDTAKIFSKHEKLINDIGPDFYRTIRNRASFVETKIRKNDVSDEILLEKFLRGYAKKSSASLKKNNNEDIISAQAGKIIHAVAAKSLGFIPNFAPPTSAIRVPWFKKFGNPAFDAIQPTLGISKASDVDTFRQVNFRSSAKGADKVGDNNIFAPLYEDFVFKAMQLVSQSKIKDQLIRGYALQPGTDQKQSAFDAFLGDIALEYKGFPKANLTGSISGNLNDKYERFAKANPAGAAKIKESIITFNELGHENQLPSAFGKTFSQLAGTSYSQMAKSSPDLVKGLSAETNSLLNSYVKNPAFLAMAAASGFIPNFAYKQAVMGLEESMSGNKAIFDTKPFPHIRNSSQPTFSSAIADHGGLSNALSDSMRGQKAAGLMSGGFIPNFADSKIDVRSLLPNAPKSWSASIDKAQTALMKLAEELVKNKTKVSQYSAELAKLAANNKIINSILPQLQQQLVQEVADKKRESRNKKFQSFGNTLAIAGPIVAGLVEQVLYGNKQRFEMSREERVGQSLSSTGLTSISTGASLGGSVGGLPGAIIGSLLGLGVAITSATQSAKLSAEELQNLADHTKTTTQNTVSSGQAYIEALKTFQTATDPEIIKKASLSLADNFQAITDVNLQKQFKEAGDDISKLSKSLFTYETSKKDIAKLQEERSLVEKLKPGSSELFLQTLGFTGTEKTGERTRGKLLGTLNKNEEDVAMVSRFTGLFSTLSTLNKDQMQELQKILLENQDDVSNIFEKLASFTDKENKAILPVEKVSEISEILLRMKSANFGASKGPTGRIPADIGFYTNLYRKQLPSTNTLSPEQIQDQANLTAAYKDLLQSTILQVGFENESYKLSKNNFEIQREYNNFLNKNLGDKKNALEADYEFARASLMDKKQIALKEKQTSIIENYLRFFETAPAFKREELKKSFVEQTTFGQQGFIEKTPQNRLEFEKVMQEHMGTSYKKEDLEALYEATQKFRAENQNINDLNRQSLEMERLRFDLAKRRLDKEQDFLFNLKGGYLSLIDDGKELTAQLGRNLPKMFADGLVDGIKAAIKESNNLGEALMGIAAKFLDEISTTLMKSSMYQILGSIGFNPMSIATANTGIGAQTKQKGGVIRAQSGMYISGSGTGDKYPALLENGEYVLNRRAVMAMGGPTSLDKLNFAAAPRFASGGSFTNEFTDLKSMEANMTTYGMENSKLYGELRDVEIAAAEERRRKAFASKQQRAAMIGSVVAAVASIGIGAGIQNVQANKFATGAKSMAQSGNAAKVSAGLSAYEGENPQFYAETGLTKQDVANFNAYTKAGLLTPTGAYSGGTTHTGLKSFFTGPTNYGQLPWYQRGSMNPFGQKTGGKQTGGLIGSRLSDTIPGYMEGGLYNTPIVKRYGVGMQAGGISPISNSNSNVVNTTNATNSFSFNTNVSRDGTIEVGSNSTSYAQQDVALSKNLNSKVYAVVLDAIKNEQRFGGSLAGTRQG